MTDILDFLLHRCGILRFSVGPISWKYLPVIIVSFGNFQKTQERVFSYDKIRPVEMIFFAFSPTHLLGPSERYVLDPRTLIGDSKRGFPAMIAERSKMIIFDHFASKSAGQVPCKI